MEGDKTYASQTLALSKAANTTDFISDFSARKTNSNDVKFADNIALRFEKDEKLSAKTGEDINEFITIYMEVAVDYELFSTKKRKYFPIYLTKKQKDIRETM